MKRGYGRYDDDGRLGGWCMYVVDSGLGSWLVGGGGALVEST